MKFKSLDWYGWFVVVFVSGSLVILYMYGCLNISLFNENIGSVSSFGSFFIFDLIGFCLGFLSLLLFFVVLFFYDSLSFRSVFYVFVSVISSLLCYSSNHVFFFWWFYEVSILSLLYLIILESPYSERYLASWYLAGYIVLTSLPMLLCLVYFSVSYGSLLMGDWMCGSYAVVDESLGVCLLLGLLFVTKIPLPPFHVWLPIVHAESTSLVSVCLSGYIMKLGVLGVCRLSWWVTSSYLFSLCYVSISFFLSLAFFFAASLELDGKRWLAFLSLSHIVICMVCLGCSLLGGSGVAFVYSVGHGLSAGLVFVFLWFGYNLSGSRNWMVLKVVFGSSVLFRSLLCGSLCTVASLPPVVQFFVEVNLLEGVGFISLVVFLFFCFYLFFSSLVPLFLLGSMLSRPYCVSLGTSFGVVNFILCIFFFVLWSFILFFVF